MVEGKTDWFLGEGVEGGWGRGMDVAFGGGCAMVGNEIGRGSLTAWDRRLEEGMSGGSGSRRGAFAGFGRGQELVWG